MIKPRRARAPGRPAMFPLFALLAVMLTVLGAFLMTAPMADARMPTCPSCGMDAIEENPVLWKHGQRTLFCGMGHKAERADPSLVVVGEATGPAEAFDSDLEPAHCPVCGMTAPDPAHRDAHAHRAEIRNGQSVWTCSAGCARMFSEDPNKYLAPAGGEPGSSDSSHHPPAPAYCTGATVMLNGFSFGGPGQTCVRFLFVDWDLTSQARVIGACIGTIVLCFLLEAIVALRGYLVSASTPSGSTSKCPSMAAARVAGGSGAPATGTSNNASPSSEKVLNYDSAAEAPILSGNGRRAPMKRTALWHVGNFLLLAAAIALAYAVMLLIMTYHAGLFISVVIGLAVGRLACQAAAASALSRVRLHCGPAAQTGPDQGIFNEPIDRCCDI
ncbi:hypothetical protein H696_00317 [Fonticula alba]|uniref:Copper transport protein n=1 Tax=Fonticula alba TaxID=691883 RepID=A0A058ZFN4_FONAL|nr:hypothetical protein H696_00317 [Fonticula alba]KCV72738.1 hypothetical protein H696_00317 [Fonticula alba]|eukprot:XP_009492439.1 hypothetical protein H696_00317 [Fonticula alba]